MDKLLAVTQIGSGDEAASIGDLNILFTNIVSIFLTLGGIALFVMILVAGFKWLSAGGDPKAIESAKQTLTWAIIGIVLLVGSYLIIIFIKEFTGVDLRQFNVIKTN